MVFLVLFVCLFSAVCLLLGFFVGLFVVFVVGFSKHGELEFNK